MVFVNLSIMELLWASPQAGWSVCLSVCLERYYWGRTRTWSFCSRPSSGWTVGGWRVYPECSVEGPLSLFVWERQLLNQRLLFEKVRMRMLDSQAEHLKLHSIRVQCLEPDTFSRMRPWKPLTARHLKIWNRFECIQGLQISDFGTFKISALWIMNAQLILSIQAYPSPKLGHYGLKYSSEVFSPLF